MAEADPEQNEEIDGINIFTGKSYPPSFLDLKYDKLITITSTQLPYFAILSFREKREYPLSGPDFKDLFKDIKDEGWAELKIADDASKPVKAALMDEYRFLETLGLALQNQDGYYISKFAYLLYDKKDGLFNRFHSDDPPADKKEELGAFMRLALTYILPGHWWRAFYARQYLPETLGHATMLNTKLLEIEHEWNMIAAQYDLPSTTT